jgi:hypothetical protein
MITTQVLKTVADFELLKEGDFLACEFHNFIYEHRKGRISEKYKFKVFKIDVVLKESKEIVLQNKNNIYFNYEMFQNGQSSLKNCVLIRHEE